MLEVFFYWRRKGMKKPPVELGVKKKKLNKKAACDKIEVVWRPHD